MEGFFFFSENFKNINELQTVRNFECEIKNRHSMNDNGNFKLYKMMALGFYLSILVLIQIAILPTVFGVEEIQGLNYLIEKSHNLFYLQFSYLCNEYNSS